MSGAEDIAILIVDDHKIARNGLRMEIEGTPGLLLVGEAKTADEALDMAARLHPDVVLMDIELGGTSGLEATRQLVAEGLAPKVLILTAHDTNDHYLLEAIQSGASGFLSKGLEGSELEHKIKNVVFSEMQAFPARSRSLLTQHEAQKRLAAGKEALVGTLSPAERRTLAAYVLAGSYKGTAERLRLSENTVKSHLSRVRTKLDVKTTDEAVSLARETGCL